MCCGLFNIWTIFVFLCVVHLSREDWVEVPQIGEKKNYKVGSNFDPLSQSAVLGGDHLGTQLSTIVSKPNQAWLDYQMERFGLNVNSPDQSTIVNNVNGFTVTDRMRYPNKTFPTTLQFNVPLKMHSSSHQPQDNEYSTIIDIHSRPQSQKKATTIHHINKIDVTAVQPNDDPDDYEYDNEGDLKTTERTTTTSSEVADSDKLSAFQKFLSYMKSIQKDLMLRASLSINEKISYLNRFKDTILFEIEDRIKSLWTNEEPEKYEESRKRVKRGIWSDDAYMAFPSNETSLMTINFLTFAVFLIKLVLKVINTIKSKHYTYNGFNVNTMEAIKIGKNRKIRSNVDFEVDPNLNSDFTTENIQHFLHNYENHLKFS